MKKFLIVIYVLLSLVSTVDAGSPEGYLSIPAIGFYKSIGFVENIDQGYDLTSLNYGIARLENTTWKRTDAGRTVIVGHTPGGFENLKKLKIRDEIILLMGDKGYTFEIFDIYVTERSDDSILTTPSPSYELVLLTCENEFETRIIKAEIK